MNVESIFSSFSFQNVQVFMISQQKSKCLGIGRGIALQLGEAGATVYITGRPHEVSISQTGRDDLPSLQKTADGHLIFT